MPTLNPILKDFWKTKARNKVLYGGRSSSKTWDTAGFAIFLAQKYKVKFLCTRQFQNKITESVYTVLKTQIDRFGLNDQFTITNNRIIHNMTGSEFVFYGLWRNIDEIKSLEGVDVCWIEEAHNLTQEQWDILEPTIRKDGSQFWVVFNPRRRMDFVYKHFIINTPPNTIVKKINYTDNPFTSQTMLDVIEAKKKESPEEFRHIYLGEPTSDSVTSIFKFKDLDRAMNRTGDTSGARVFGIDVARFGDDSSVICHRNGLQVMPFLLREKLSTVEVANWAMNEHQKYKTDGCVVDTIGVGAGVFDQLQSRGIYVTDGNFGMKADDPDTYMNKRAECYFRLKEALDRGLALPNDDSLVEELLSINYSFTETGKIKIQPKDQIKEELGRSPDKADALALTFFTTFYVNEDLPSWYTDDVPDSVIF